MPSRKKSARTPKLHTESNDGAKHAGGVQEQYEAQISEQSTHEDEDTDTERGIAMNGGRSPTEQLMNELELSTIAHATRGMKGIAALRPTVTTSSTATDRSNGPHFIGRGHEEGKPDESEGAAAQQTLDECYDDPRVLLVRRQRGSATQYLAQKVEAFARAEHAKAGRIQIGRRNK